jgi:group II intron reverse transcriptase/maturase
MQNANTVLSVIHKCGRQRKPLQRLYRQLFNRDLYLMAYGRLYRNSGSMTPGTTPETVDGMTLTKIDAIIDRLRTEQYRWTSVRRVNIPKANGKTRPLGVPTWSDKLLQEVMRLLLSAYYEPQFSPQSHGFRPGRGCHSALREIYYKWPATTWFIEGDIAQCFESLDHSILLAMMAEKIQDGRFLQLVRGLLNAGYLADWTYHRTLSGTPQGGVISPILANIYMDRFDQFVTTNLIPRYTRGEKRAANPAYTRISNRINYLRYRGKARPGEIRQLQRRQHQTPSIDTNDPAFRRLRYVRYADDFLLGYSGPRHEAEAIKEEIRGFLRTTLQLELSESKTLITHARTEAARFLGYNIVVLQDDQKRHESGKRSINGGIGFQVPGEVVRAYCARYCARGKPVHRKALTNNSVYSILAQYQTEFRGLVEYYRLAYNLSHTLDRVKWVMGVSLTKTLANKLRISARQVRRRYKAKVTIDGKERTVLQERIDRPGKPPLIAYWGGISLEWDVDASANDAPAQFWAAKPTEIVQRLLANVCELCGTGEPCEVHHIRALKDLRRPGQKELPRWKKLMLARRRKTLVVCRPCHLQIHQGAWDGTPHRI